MTHYKSNLRDLEFNLFEVFGADAAFGQGPYADLDVDTARNIIGEVDRLAREDLAASYAEGDRNPPVFDPQTHTAPVPAAFKKSFDALMDSEFWRLDLPEALEGTLAPRVMWWALAELILGSNAADLDVRLRPVLRAHAARRGHRTAEEVGPPVRRQAVGVDDGAHRARRGFRRRRRPHPRDPAARRHLAHRGREAVHHVRRARPDRQHHPLRAGAPGRRRRRRRPGHQGPVAVRRPEVPLRRGDRRAGRAQRRLRHQRRAQDGHQGLQHLRADLRRARHARGRIPAGRRARGHPADVPDHRVRPHDGRHEGDRHAVHRLPQRARVRQGAGAGRRPAADDRQDRAAGDDLPPPRRTPVADAPEVLRRGPARPGRLHRDLAGPGRHRGSGRRRPPPSSWPSGSTTCCCRWSRASARSGRTSCSVTSRCRPSAAPDSSRTTRWSSTSATPRSTPCTRARPPSRASTSSSARS